MNIHIENQKLPDIYMSRGHQCYLDSVRGKLVYITPEEIVRQRMISYLLYELHVPKEMITVEARLLEYGIRSKRRADIIVHGRNEDGTRYPVLVVECKAPDVYLDEKTHTQVFDYCDELGADYAVVVNGYEWFCYKYNADRQQYDEITQLPLYEEILTGKYELRDLGIKPKRIPFENYEDFLKEEFESYSEDYYGTDISKTTPMPIAKAALNLCEALLDLDHKMPEGQYGLFRLVQDYGIRMLSYGNAGGGSFYGPYRSFFD